MDFLQILSIIGATVFMVFFFGMCIFIHELGHFLAAKWRGMHITAFSIGFKKAWGYKYKGVEYRIGWFPFGGYVEIPQIDSADKVKDENGNPLPPVKPFDRMIAVVAGPLFNFIFGFALACVIWYYGIPQDTTVLKEIVVDEIVENSAEYKAGLRKGDVITHINGVPVNTTWNGVVRDIITTIGKVTLTVQRSSGPVTISYQPGVNKRVLPDEEIAYPFFMPRLPIDLYPDKGSPAEKAGILNGDKAILINGKKVLSLEDFEQEIDNSNGNPIDITVIRKGRETVIRGVKPDPFRINGEDGVYMAGIRYNPSHPVLTVLSVSKNYPAEKAGLLKDDKILKIDGKEFRGYEFPMFVRNCSGKALTLTVERAGKTFETKLTPEFKRYYTIGVQYAYLSFPTPIDQFNSVMSLTYKSMRGLFVGLANKVGLTEAKTTIQPRHMSGPIGIGRILYLSVYKGSLIQGLNLVVLITFNLGLLNLLPIPVLDGGHVVLSLLEMIFKKKVSPKILQPITTTFVVILIAFMLFVTFYDTKRLITSISPDQPDGSAIHLKKAPPQNDPKK